MQQFIDRIRDAIASSTGLPADEVRIENPRDTKLGDLAFPCFVLAKSLKQAPPKIAAELAEKLAAELPGIEVLPTGPYLNFRIARPALAASIVGEIAEQKERYGASAIGEGKTVVLDFSSPNIAKPMHVGHLRSTIIGAAIQRILDIQGFRTVGINHIGDWGSQFGKLVAAISRWGDEFDLEGQPIQALLDLYARYHDEEKEDPSLTEEARAAFRELESGVDGEVRKTWRWLTEISLKEFDRVYKRLGVSFDHVRGEAYYEPFLDETVERVVQSGVTEESEGALIVRLDEIHKNMAPCLLRKTDGTTLYATRDLAAVFQRWEEFAFERCLYVVGSDQRLHFRQLKTVLSRMGLEWEPRMEHVDFGMLRLPEGKLSTRNKRVVFLDDLLDAAVDRVRAILEEREAPLNDPEAVAEAVGVGAVVFNDLKKERSKDVLFDWEQVLAFEGETGPYAQYTHARLASILRKAEPRGLVPTEGSAVAELPAEAVEDAAGILLLLGRFPAVIRSAGAHAEPSEVTVYVLELCRATNSWLAANKVLGEDAEVSGFRLALVRACKIVIGNGLRLLGVAAPEEM